MFAMMHPMKRPGIAAGVKKGRMVICKTKHVCNVCEHDVESCDNGSLSDEKSFFVIHL